MAPTQTAYGQKAKHDYAQHPICQLLLDIIEQEIQFSSKIDWKIRKSWEKLRERRKKGGKKQFSLEFSTKTIRNVREMIDFVKDHTNNSKVFSSRTDFSF